jgi:hypothetical protein
MFRFGRSLVRKFWSGEVRNPHAQEWGSHKSKFLAMAKSAFHVKSYVILDRSEKKTFLLGQKYLGKSRFHVVKSGETRVNVSMSRGVTCPHAHKPREHVLRNGKAMCPRAQELGNHLYTC